MNEEQLANLLAEQLDALLAGAPLPEGLPDEVAELLAIAQNLAETAPIPRPELGPALKESLLGPSSGGNGATPTAGPTFTGQIFFIVVIGLLVLAAGLALIVGGIIFGVARSNLSVETPTFPAPISTQPVGSPSPIQTPSMPIIQTPSPLAPTVAATAPMRSTDSPASPTLTATPIVDVLPAISVTVEIRIEPPDLIPGPNGGGGGGGGGGDDSDDDDDDDDGGGDDDD